MEWFTKPQFTKHNPCSPWWQVGCTAKRIGILISNQFQVLQSPVEMPLCASVQAMASWCCCSDALNEKPQKPNCKHQHSKSTTSWRSSILPLPGAKVLRWLLFKTHFYSAFCFVVVSSSPPPPHRSHYIAKQPCSQYSLSSQHCMLTCCTRASQGSPFSPHCSILWSPLRPRRINMYWTWSCRFKAKCKAAHSAADQPRAPCTPRRAQSSHPLSCASSMELSTHPQCHKQYLIWIPFILSLFAIFHLNLFWNCFDTKPTNNQFQARWPHSLPKPSVLASVWSALQLQLQKLPFLISFSLVTL